MDFSARRHERGSNWTDPEIVELLQLWSDESVQIELESSLRNQRVFDRIAHILREKGIYRTGDQCREKIKKMKLEYRRIKDNHKMRSWKFYDVMDRVLTSRPAVTYSSLGGAVIAHQVFQSPGAPEGGLQGVPQGSFGPASSGGFLFGQPPKPGDPLGIKCEDVEEGMLNSGVAPPEMYYGSGDDQEADGQSLLGAEETLGRAESSTNARISPSGISDLNIAGSAASATQLSGPSTRETPGQPGKKGPHPPTSNTHRKRRRGGKASWGRRGSSTCAGQDSLNTALASFLTWQQSAEERLLSLEEARLERELEAEERREQREERRAEQERQHELRLFSMLTGALLAVRQGAPATSADSSAHLSAAFPVPSGSSEPPPEAPTAPPVPAEGAEKSQPTSVKARQMSRNVLAALGKAEAAGHSVYLSNRGNSIRQHEGILQKGFAQYLMDQHHDTDNPDGIINLGTSENKLCNDLLHARLTKPDMLYVDPSLLQYPDWRGHAFLREQVAKFLTHYCSSPKPLKADNVVVVNGCSSLFSCLAAVICDPKDAILIPTPFYGAVTEDLDVYCDVKLFHVPLECEGDGKESRPFHLTVGKLEEGLKRARQEGLIIRGIILINPHNPLAEIYTPKEMTAFLEFAKRHELHAIVDEVYMLTVFDESLTFHSVLSIDSLPDPQRTHIMWGLSKDFAMSGIRIGTLYTENRDLVEAVAKVAFLHGIPGTTQHQAAQLLKDREWINEVFLPENRQRLKAVYSYVTRELRSLGIPYLDRPAALYVWADFRKYLRESSFEEELSLWSCFLKHKVLLSCSLAFSCTTPGWFRIIFSVEQHHLQLAFKRVREALKETEEKITIPDSHSSRQTSEERKMLVKEDSTHADNAAIVNSTSSPQSKSSTQLKERDRPVPDTGSQATQDCRASEPSESLDSLIGTLRHQIRSSDWLEKNTPELSAGEDPEILDAFKVLLQRAGKGKPT